MSTRGPPRRSDSPARGRPDVKRNALVSNTVIYYIDIYKDLYKGTTDTPIIKFNDTTSLSYNQLKKGRGHLDKIEGDLLYTSWTDTDLKTPENKQKFSIVYKVLRKNDYIFNVISNGTQITKDYIIDAILYYLYYYIEFENGKSSIPISANETVPADRTRLLEDEYKQRYKIKNQKDNKLFNLGIENILNVLRKLILSINFYTKLLEFDLKTIKSELKRKRIHLVEKKNATDPVTQREKIIYTTREVTEEEINKVANYLFDNKIAFKSFLEALAQQLSFFFVIAPIDSLYETKEPDKIIPKQRKIIGYRVNCYGGTNKTKTNEKFQYNKKNYIIYLGSRGGRYIQVNNVFKNINHL